MNSANSFSPSFIMRQGSRTKFYLLNLNHLSKIYKRRLSIFPDGIEYFLAAVCNMFLQDVIDCWGVDKELDWEGRKEGPGPDWDHYSWVHALRGGNPLGYDNDPRKHDRLINSLVATSNCTSCLLKATCRGHRMLNLSGRDPCAVRVWNNFLWWKGG